MVTVLFAAMAFGTCVWAQSDAGSETGSMDEVIKSLEKIMLQTETAVMYVAPSVEDFETLQAFDRLELLADNTEKSMQYEAPSVERAEFNEALDRLEMLANSIEDQVRYEIPEEIRYYINEYAVGETNQKNKTSTRRN